MCPAVGCAFSLPPSAHRAAASLTEGGEGDGFPRQSADWLGMTALRADGTSRTPSPAGYTFSLPPSAHRAATSLAEGGKGNGFPRQCEHWLGMTALRADGTSRTPSPTDGSPYCAVGRGLRAPPKSTYIPRRDTWVPPYRARRLHGAGRGVRPDGMGCRARHSSVNRKMCKGGHCCPPLYVPPSTGESNPTIPPSGRQCKRNFLLRNNFSLILHIMQ